MVDTNAIMSQVGNEINWLISKGAPMPEAMEVSVGSLSSATITLIAFAGVIVQTPQPIMFNGVNVAKAKGQITTYAITPDRLKANPAVALVELRKWGLALGDYMVPVSYNPAPSPTDPPKQVLIDDVVGALDPNRKGPQGQAMYEPTPGPYAPTPGTFHADSQGHNYVCIQVTQGFGGIIRWMRMS